MLDKENMQELIKVEYYILKYLFNIFVDIGDFYDNTE
jgi:hypothetical protein